jgi:hypothetical protein
MPAPFRAGFPPEHPFPNPSSRRFSAPSPPVPVVYESTELEKTSLRTYAAIQLRVPESGIEWLDDMIRRSRDLDSKETQKP